MKVEHAASATRCPACGQRIATPAPRCPLCDFKLVDGGATGEDITPYARSYALDRPRWAAMLLWVWSAGSGRIKHLALMKASAASRRFATINALLLAVGAGLCEWTMTGWHWSYAVHSAGAVRTAEPAGEGWFAVASVARPLPPGLRADAPTDLWWNPAQCLIAAPVAGVLALVLFWAFGRLVDVSVRWAHRAAYRGEQRMTAALRYSTAWIVPLLAGAGLLLARPVGYAALVEGWSWAPVDSVYVALAAVTGGATLALWWFWLVRLGATAPASTRARVVGFFVGALPLLLAGSVGAWWLARRWLYGPIFEGLGLQFS